MTVEQLPAYLKQHWPAIREQLLQGTYKPQYLRTREFRLTIQDGLEQFEAAIRQRIPADQIDFFFEAFEE